MHVPAFVILAALPRHVEPWLTVVGCAFAIVGVGLSILGPWFRAWMASARHSRRRTP
jgi:hypothetical protein